MEETSSEPFPDKETDPLKIAREPRLRGSGSRLSSKVDYEDVCDGGSGAAPYQPNGGNLPGGPIRLIDDVEIRHRHKGLRRYLEPNCPCKPNLTKRMTMAILSSVGFLISFGMRCNWGVSLVAITKEEHSVFDWSHSTIGFMDSSFFVGYLVMLVPGGCLASIFPANRIFGTAIAATACMNMLMPVALTTSVGAIVSLRMLQGLIEGMTFPACHGIWRFWAPPMERTKLATLAFSGSYAGAVVGIPLSSFLTDRFGWRLCFYFYGICGVIWYMFWLWLSFERPASHPTITAQERQYIEESLGTTSQVAPTSHGTPWKYIFTSLPVWAIFVASFCGSGLYYILVISQPKYFYEVHGLHLAESSLLGGLPYLLMAFVVPFGGQLADYLRRRQALTTTQVRKLFNCGGFGMEALFLLFVAFSRTTTAAVTSLMLAVGFSGFGISGFNVNHLDIAPRYASILMGLSTFVGILAGMSCPVVVELVSDYKHPEKAREQWQQIFVMAALIQVGGVIFYALFASGDKQSWAEPPTEAEAAQTGVQNRNPGIHFEGERTAS